MSIAPCFTRVFSSHEGEEVLQHLKHLTLERTLSPDASDAALRFLEGQRALVAHIINLIKQGKEHD